MRRAVCFLALVIMHGCNSPENGRKRGGGHGGDAGNYVSMPVHAPSKIDGSRDLKPIEPR